MTLQDKIAALPKMPTLAVMAEPNRVYLLTEVECLYARNALLCEALRGAFAWNCDQPLTVNQIRAVLAACEVQP